MTERTGTYDIAALRRRLAAADGPAYWRSLDEVAGSDDFRRFVDHEFPHLSALWEQAVDRRNVLKMFAASVALAGVSGCGRQPPEEIVPYVEQPEQVVPGRPLFFATALVRSGYGVGVLAESHTGRPTKIEGNPLHPASLGATDAIMQAAVLDVYDPDRSAYVVKDGQPSTWDGYLAMAAEAAARLQASGGQGLRVLTGTVTSPTLDAQLTALLQRFPEARWHEYEPAGDQPAREGTRLAFGEDASVRYQLDQAGVVLSLDSHLFFETPGRLRYARDYAERRMVRSGGTDMPRFYAVESATTFTGASADHRLAVRPSEVEAIARAIAARLGLGVAAPDQPPPAAAAWLDAVVGDLQEHGGASVVVAGEHQPPAVHALALAINERLGAIGRTVIVADPVAREASAGVDTSIAALARDMAAGEVDTLLILGGNPAYDAPADLEFGILMGIVPTTVHFGLYPDETAALARWHLPAAHDLESWSDVRAFDGTATVLQPLIRPLFGGRTVHEALAAWLGGFGASGYDLVRSRWLTAYQGGDFDRDWRQALHDGVVPDTAAAPRTLRIRGDLAGRLDPPPRLQRAEDGLEIGFRPDPTVWDGRYANNAWLQELPKPLTKRVWDNAATVSPADAERLGLATGDVVELTVAERRLEAPVWIEPGQPRRTVTVALGYGRARAGRVGSHIGVNAYALRGTDSMAFAPVSLRLHAAGQHAFASTQHHHALEGRHMVRHATLPEFRDNPNFVADATPGGPPEHTLYPEYAYEEHAWGMVIDETVCIGCSACVAACQAENNIPVVGKEEVQRGHEMHWLRVDRYYHGGLDDPEVLFQPVPCMQCEKAPCEYVCPVNATVHTDDGLNAMVYNRCVGTRYCSQNCPYKVRRFNWLNWNYPSGGASAREPLMNPDVSVRSRGVMEKCTYCVQRIRKAVIDASREQRPIPTDAVRTACQQACPTGAIVFGDLRDAASEVARLKGSPLNYTMLAELNTRPRTTYLGLVRNPNPLLSGANPEDDDGAA